MKIHENTHNTSSSTSLVLYAFPEFDYSRVCDKMGKILLGMVYVPFRVGSAYAVHTTGPGSSRRSKMRRGAMAAGEVVS